jgi:hypothetical protein
MHYRTIVLELLQDHPTLHERLRESKSLLQTLERSAAHLRARHMFWMARLARTETETDPSQLSSSALEIAVQVFRDTLPPETPDDPDSLSLDEAMGFFSRHTPRA